MAEKTETQSKKLKEIEPQKIEKIVQIVGIFLCFLIAFGLAFTKIWPLAFLAAIIGGVSFKKMKFGFIVGMLGVGLGWTLYIVIQIASSNIVTLINQVTGIIIGNQSLGWVIILVIVIVGFLIGMLGGTLGSGLRKIIQTTIEKKKNE